MFGKYIKIFGFMAVLSLAQMTFAADFQVNLLDDSGDGVCDATCTLRDAVISANGTTANDSISFSYVVFNSGVTISVTGAEIVIANNGSLSINGIGADKITVNGMGNARIFTVSTGAVVSIKGLGFRNGTGAGAANTGRGGAIYNNGGMLTLRDSFLFVNTAANGGALNTASSGTTDIINCDFFLNSATGSGGALQNFSGSFTNIYDSTFRNNTSNSTTVGGGAMQANGRVTITNSTFSGNSTTGDGGAIVYNGQSLIMTNTTITGNMAGDLSGGLHKSTTIDNAIIRNNIIAGNTAATNMADTQGLFMSQGFNLIQNPGTTTGLIATDITGMAALLSPLGNFGGMTLTHALLDGSPAIDAGDNCVIDLSCATGNPPVAVLFDQRGAMRPVNNIIDIGSFERSPSFVVKLNDGAVNVPYLETISPNRGSFIYTLVGQLPPGLTLDDGGLTGITTILGTPTMLGTYNFQIVISNGTNSTTVNYSIRIAPTNLTGRLLDDAGNPISGVFVTLSDGMGGIQRAQTTVNGTYTFTNVTAGTTYTVSFNSRRYAFRSEAIQIIPGTNRLDPIIP